MQLNKLIIEPRVRSAWASIDLGTILARQLWLRGVMLYLVVALPVYTLTRFLFDYSGWLSFFILWWFKPLYERPFLFSLSREMFSEPMGFWQTLKSYKLWLYPSLLSIITIRRLSINRAMFAPISLLEQPISSDYGRRTHVLGNTYSNASTWLTIVAYHFEGFLATAALALLVFLFPENIQLSLAWLVESQRSGFQFDLATALLIPMAFVAPFYCASGFMLYICRRIELEGWDIEICFRDWMRGYVKDKAYSEDSDHA